MRTNASGIGARLAVRTGARWTVVDTYRADSGPGQSLQPLMLGLGGAPRIDFVSIDWSDGVLQTEMDLAAGSAHIIAETQRQLSSCPVLFSWDGEDWVFVSDLLGVGGIGYALAPGEYWSYALAPDGRSLVFASEQEGNREIYVMAVDVPEEGFPFDYETNLDDAGVAQHGRHLDFPLKTGAPDIRGQRSVHEHLYGHNSIRGKLPGAVDHPLAPALQLHDPVVSG